MNHPPQSAAEKAAEAYAQKMYEGSTRYDIVRAHRFGWTACLAHLEGLAPEFDKAASDAARSAHPTNGPVIEVVAFERAWDLGARWQHQQMAAQVAAANMRYADSERKYANDIAQLREQLAAISDRS